jgi:uncharacterized membrane protein
MNQKIKLLIVALLPLAVGLSVGFLLAPKRDAMYEKALKEQDANYGKLIETYRKEFNIFSYKLMKAEEEIENYRKGLEVENHKTEYWKKKYENSKNTPVSITDQRELDSMLDALYPR